MKEKKTHLTMAFARFVALICIVYFVQVISAKQNTLQTYIVHMAMDNIKLQEGIEHSWGAAKLAVVLDQTWISVAEVYKNGYQCWWSQVCVQSAPAGVDVKVKPGKLRFKKVGQKLGVDNKIVQGEANILLEAPLLLYLDDFPILYH